MADEAGYLAAVSGRRKKKTDAFNLWRAWFLHFPSEKDLHDQFLIASVAEQAEYLKALKYAGRIDLADKLKISLVPLTTAVNQ